MLCWQNTGIFIFFKHLLGKPQVQVKMGIHFELSEKVSGDGSRIFQLFSLKLIFEETVYSRKLVVNIVFKAIDIVISTKRLNNIHTKEKPVDNFSLVRIHAIE